MSIMGMKTWIYYFTWFLRYFIEYAIVHLICAAIFSASFKSVPYYIPLVVFLLFDILLIVQNFFIQMFVTRSKIGIVFALLFFIAQYVIYYTVANNPDATVSIYRAVSIVPHIAFILAFKEMLYAESLRNVLTFTELVNKYTIVTCIVSLILNIIFWGLLAMYFNEVFPN